MSDLLYKEGYTQNRELSWLKFNERVLQEAEDEKVPLLEKLKFISIFTSNLDEFFMVRVGSLFDIMNIDKKSIDSKSGWTPEEQLEHIYENVRPLYKKKDEFYNTVEKDLRVYGISNLNYKELEDNEQREVKSYFRNSVMPVLSPQIIDSHHPFPHLQNNVLHIAVHLKFENNNLFGFIPVPSVLPSYYLLNGNDTRYILIENILLHFVENIFENYTVLEACVIKVTRNADINFDDDNFDIDTDIRKEMKNLLKKRTRLAPVRLEISKNVENEFRDYLCNKLNINKKQVFHSKSPLEMKYAFKIISDVADNKIKLLTYKPFEPQIPSDIMPDESIIKQIQKKDILLYYPYESMKPFISLIKEASVDPTVVSIKITIYRLANKAKLVEYLCAAAENGKDVTVLIELRARFDEQNNIDWSERLEEAGCNIIYGFEAYKVHSKICLITIKEKNEIKYITQIATGNYNEKTAKMYTDLSLMTYNQDIGKDASLFFKNMCIGNLEGSYNHLLVSPFSMKQSVINMVREQSDFGADGLIFIKLNSLTDVDIISELKNASCKGVKIYLVIRGICCLVPGVNGKTDNINVSSVVGRFLEHSRIYSFGKGTEQKLYISSADFMTRNTERRVEVACPISNKQIKERINDIIKTIMSDNEKQRVLQPDGTYIKKNRDGTAINSQEIFLQEAKENQQKTLSDTLTGGKNGFSMLLTNIKNFFIKN